MDKQQFYEEQELRLQDAIEHADPNGEEYPKLLARMELVDLHKNRAVERKVANDRRQEKGFKKWIGALNPNTVVEVAGGVIAYLGGIKMVTVLEKGGGAFISGAKSLFSKVKLRI